MKKKIKNRGISGKRSGKYVITILIFIMSFLCISTTTSSVKAEELENYRLMLDTTPESQEVVYNNTAQSPKITITDDDYEPINPTLITIKYSEDEGQTYTLDTIPSYTNIGEYPIYYQISSDSYITSGNKHTLIGETLLTILPVSIAEAEVAPLVGWICEDGVTLTAPTGYTISLTNGVADEFASFVTVITEQNENVEIIYYLRNITTGAISEAKIFTYSNDQIAPTGEIVINKNKWNQFMELITFGIYESKDLQVSIMSEDLISGMDTIEYYEASTAKTFEEVEAITDWKTYSNSYTILAQDATQIVVYAKLTDNAGNVTYLSTNGVVFDTSEPVISGVKNNGYYATDLSIEVLDKNLDHVTLNGQEVEPSFQLAAGIEQMYTIVATDKAGNTTSIVFHMYVKNVPVEDVLDNLPTVDENATEEEKDIIRAEIKETVNNLTEAYLEELNKKEDPDTETPDTETPDTEDEIIDKVNKLDESLIEANPTLSVAGTTKIIHEDIPEDKKAVEAEIIPQGLAVAIFGSNLYQTNSESHMELSLSVAQTGGNEDGLIYDVKPMISIDGAEANVISNADLSAPVTFRLYVNDGFQGDMASVEHVKEDGSSAFYEQKTLYQDTHGNYINLSAYEFSIFIVREVSNDVEDGVADNATDGVVSNVTSNKSVALTGDHEPIGILIILIGVSVGGIGVTLIMKNRSKKGIKNRKTSV